MLLGRRDQHFPCSNHLSGSCREWKSLPLPSFSTRYIVSVSYVYAQTSAILNMWTNLSISCKQPSANGSTHMLSHVAEQCLPLKGEDRNGNAELLGGCWKHESLCQVWEAAHGMDRVLWGCSCVGKAQEMLCCGKLDWEIWTRSVLLQPVWKLALRHKWLCHFCFWNTIYCQLHNFLLFIVSLIFVSRLCSILLPAFANTCYKHLLKLHINVVLLLAFQTRLMNSDLP